MKKNTAIVWGVIVVIVVIGLIFYANRNTNPSSTETEQNPVVSTNPVQTTAPVPGVPKIVTSANNAPTDTTVIVTGTVTPNGTFTNYWYEYGTTPNLGTKTSNQSIGSGYSSITAPGYITGLTKDTTYYFRLVAENQYGRFAGTSYSFQTTHGNLPPEGSVPTIQTSAANNITRTSVSLNGEVTSNKAITTYWYEYGKTPNLGNVTSLVGVAANSVRVSASMSLANLDPATTYYFRLDAQNQFGTVNGTIQSFKTASPAVAAAPTVTTRSATSVGSSGATLRGTVDPNGTATSYWFEYSSDSSFGSGMTQITDTTPIGSGESAVSISTNISGLASSTSYYFRAVAQNASGTVHGSNASFKTR